jgi:hypothetical protein
MGDDVRGAIHETWGPSSKEAFITAVQHFDRFLAEELANPEDGNEMATDLFGTETPVNPSFATVEKHKINIKLMNRFAKYLAERARWLNDENRMLEFQTADRYLSSIKTKIHRDLSYDERNQSPLTDAKMKPVRSGMVNIFIGRAIKMHRSLSTSHKTAESEHIMRITMLCVWMADFQFAQLAFFVLALVHFCGRGSEVAVVIFRRLSLYQPSEFADAGAGADKIANVTLWRTKTKEEQELSVFHHRDCFLMCWYFTMAYSMLMCEGEPSESLFPSFVKKGQADLDQEAAVDAQEAAVDAEDALNAAALRRDDATISPEATEAKGVSKYFKNILKQLADAAAKLTIDDANMPTMADMESNENDAPARIRPQPPFMSFLGETSDYTFSEGLSSHSAKRFAVNYANEFAYICTSWVCFRAGWLMKAVHTIFDYLDRRAKNDRQVARVTSNWTQVGEGGLYGGGRPPSLDALVGEPGCDVEQVLQFVILLFFDYKDVEGASDPELQKMLTATILLRLSQLLLCLQEHPGRVFGTTDEMCFAKHRFLQKLHNAALRVNITDPITTLNAWATVIEADFYRRNFLFVPLKDLKRTLGVAGFECDTRTLTGFMQGAAGLMGEHSHHLLRIETGIRRQMAESIEVRRLLREQQLTQQGMQVQQNEMSHMLQQLLSQSLGSRVILAAAPATQPTNAATPPLTAMVPLQPPTSIKGLTVKGVFMAWHSEGYNLSLSEGKEKHVKSIITICVAYFSLFFVEHIRPLPEGARCGALAPEWHDELKRKTEVAWKAAEDFAKTIAVAEHGVKFSDSLTGFKKYMYQLNPSQLPQGPTGESKFQPRTGRLKNRDDLVKHNDNASANHTNTEDADAETDID